MGQTITFIDRFIINLYRRDSEIRIAFSPRPKNSIPFNIDAVEQFVGVLLYVAYKLNYKVTKALNDYLLLIVKTNERMIVKNIDDLVNAIKTINAKYHADPVIKSMMTSWTLCEPFPESILKKAKTKVLALKRKYVNKQGYIKNNKPGVVRSEGMSASYILHNSFFNMYEISYFSYPKTSNSYTVYNIELIDKSGTDVENGLFVLVALLNLLASSLNITVPAQNTNTSGANLQSLCNDMIHHINNVELDPVSSIKVYTDSTFLKIKTILEQLDKLYKTNPVVRELIDYSYVNFATIQFIELP